MKVIKYREKGGSLNCWNNFDVFSHQQNGITDRWKKTYDRNTLYAINQIGRMRMSKHTDR